MPIIHELYSKFVKLSRKYKKMKLFKLDMVFKPDRQSHRKMYPWEALSCALFGFQLHSATLLSIAYNQTSPYQTVVSKHTMWYIYYIPSLSVIILKKVFLSKTIVGRFFFGLLREHRHEN